MSSVSDGIDDTEQIGGGLIETLYMLREYDKSYWLGKEGGYRAQIKVSPEIYHCQHVWDQQNLVYSLFSVSEWPTEEEPEDMEVLAGLQQLEELILCCKEKKGSTEKVSSLVINLQSSLKKLSAV